MHLLTNLQLDKENSGSAAGSSWFPSPEGPVLDISSPINNTLLAKVRSTDPDTYTQIIQEATKASIIWKDIPAPKRGEIVRQLGDIFRMNKTKLAELLIHEMGKPIQEAHGEIQEVIDICDFAVGLSRQLSGITIHSERPQHRLYEQYHPLGIVGIITSFNFPIAVWAWNAMIAAVCGNVMLWKPSSRTPLIAVAVQKILGQILAENNLPDGIFSLMVGSGKEIGQRMAEDKNIHLISFTGSTATGRIVSQKTAHRFGKQILELGGNNACILTEYADLKLAIPAVVFSAIGTAGQRCTSLRRLIVHESKYKQVKQSLLTAYSSLKIGNPLEDGIHMGPLIDTKAIQKMQQSIKLAKNAGASILYGDDQLPLDDMNSDCYVKPVIIEADNNNPAVQQETFAPILYMIPYYGPVTNAITIQNQSAHGLSSSIFTTSLQEAEQFLAASGSDCGITNVNVGTSGAEIGGAFGGEKETGGGRESGSDAWKSYMRRQTVTINYGSELPLAQGIKFEI